MQTSKTENRKVSEIVWREDLYPRFEPDASVIQKYAEDIDRYPPVEINQNNELIDGYHRWTAYKKAEVEIIKVTVTRTDSDRHFARLAMSRNAQHGLCISNAEKKDWLLTWYVGESNDEKQTLANDMGVSLRTVKRWTARKDKDLKAKRKRKAFDLWLGCETVEDIGNTLGVTHTTAENYIEELQKNDKWHKFAIFPDYGRDPDWKPPLYNVWKQQEKSGKLVHYGNSEASFLDRLLYQYTEMFDIVLDPFAGSGTTIDVCKKRLRRYWVCDRKPIVEREREIRQQDIMDGPPLLHTRWGQVALLFLDPPYWKQAENEYSEDSEDLANMELGKFYEVLTGFVSACANKMHAGSHVAMLMQPTQWRAPDRRTIDHVFDIRAKLLRSKKLRFVQTIQCPYESQQANAQQVEWAKEERKLLEIGRTITVWEVTD